MLEEKKSSKMSGLLIWTEQLESWIVVGRILVEKIWENHVMLDEHGIAMIAYAPLCIIEGFGGWYGVTEKPLFLKFMLPNCVHGIGIFTIHRWRFPW